MYWVVQWIGIYLLDSTIQPLNNWGPVYQQITIWKFPCILNSHNWKQVCSYQHKSFLFSKVFEEDALQWEEKLNRIHDVFDVWIDVQRRWVYLDGIFSGSADIKALLPVETQRFQRWDLFDLVWR